MSHDNNIQSKPLARRSPNRMTWNKCSLFVILAMVLGAGIPFLPRALWLGPPLVQYTPLVYWAAVPAWLLVLIVCALLRPTGGLKISLLLVVLGLAQICMAITLLGPVAVDEACTLDVSCQRQAQPISTSRVRYTCVGDRDSEYCSGIYYVLEGPAWSPILWLIEEGRR